MAGDNVIQFPPREIIAEPRQEYIGIAQAMLAAADEGQIQRSWVHAVACAMTQAYQDGYEAATTQERG